MQRNTIIKSLFLKGEPSFLKLSEVLNALNRVRSQEALDCIARQVIEVANRARLLRDRELSREASSLLLSLPLSMKLRSVAEFYTTPLRLPSTADLEPLRRHLFRCAENAEDRYVPRIILKIGHSYDSEGNFEEALRYFAEAGKAASKTDAVVAAQAARTIAGIRGTLGDNAGALRTLESLWPIIQSLSSTCPYLSYLHLNNLAVVLSATGRTEEARAAIQGALRFPLAHRFPEWRETQTEIEEAAQKGPHRRPATLEVVPIPAPRARPCKTPIRASRNSPTVFFIAFVRRTPVARITPRERNIVSPLLERYVKTVRIRQP